MRRVRNAGVPVFSDATFAELEARIWNLQFDRHLGIQVRQGILHAARAVGHRVDISPRIVTLQSSRDAADDKFIHTALAGAALWLVTGNRNLLVIRADLGVGRVAPGGPFPVKQRHAFLRKAVICGLQNTPLSRMGRVM